MGHLDSATIGRRTLLGAGLVAGAGTVVAGCVADNASSGQLPPFNPKDWDSVRAQFPLRPNLAHFAAFVLAAHPAPVREAIDRHRAGLDADTDGYLHGGADLEEAVREAAGEYLSAKPGDIALTDSTTMGMGLLCGGAKLTQGQDVLTTEHDFFGTHSGLLMLAQRTGAEVRRVRLYDDPANASAADIVERLREQVRPRTRVVVVTWVHSSTGVRLPIKAIADMIAERNRNVDPPDHTLLWVDGVHGFGAVDANVADLGCDFLTTGTHKWLFGPRGTGLLWGRAWDTVAPLIPSFSGPEAPGPRGTPGGYHSFEYRWAVKEAFEFHRAVGRDRIAARVRELATRLKDGLAGIPSVRLITPRDPTMSAGLVMCEITGVNPHSAVKVLREQHRIVASVIPYLEQYLRFGTTIVNTPEQVDQVIKAVATLK